MTELLQELREYLTPDLHGLASLADELAGYADSVQRGLRWLAARLDR